MNRPKRLVVVAAALSLAAALIHLWVTSEHFDEWWGYGAFFLVVATAQALYAVALVRRPRPWLLALGTVGNLAIIGLWVVTRTLGVPSVGPAAGETEPVGSLDVASKLAEAGLVAILLFLRGRADGALLPAEHAGQRRTPRPSVAPTARGG